MKKLQMGDKINIKYVIDGVTINDTATITFLNNNFLFTCGHCFPKNAKTNLGKLIYSSGFDNPTEKKEIAIIKIHDSKLPLFKRINVTNNYKYYSNLNTIMVNNRIKYNGFIISKITKNLNKGWQNINKKYKINHQITKLEPPYFLVGIEVVKNEGLSGSPWIVLQIIN